MRKCGTCEVCCELAEVQGLDFFKPAGQKCKYQCNGCSIFNDEKRPSVCNTFKCGWLRNIGNENDRPDKSGVMVSINKMNGGTWLVVMETKKNAHKTTGKNIIINAINKINLPAIISDYDTNFGNDYGDYVAIHEKMLPRSKNLIKEYLYDLNKDIKVYNLEVH